VHLQKPTEYLCDEKPVYSVPPPAGNNVSDQLRSNPTWEEYPRSFLRHDELPTRLYIRTAPFPAALFRVSEQRTIHDDLCGTDKQLVSTKAIDTIYLV